MNAGAVVTALAAANAVKYADRLLLAPLLPGISQEFGAGDAALGAAASAFMLAYPLAAPLWGLKVQDGNRPAAMAGGFFIAAAAMAASGFARSAAELAGARALLGVGQAGFTAAAPGFLSDQLLPSTRVRAFAVFKAAVPVGAAAGFAVGGTLSDAWGWRAAFFCAAGASILAAVGLARLKDPLLVEAPASKPQARDYWPLYRIPGFAAASFAAAALTMTAGAFSLWGPSYLSREFGLGAGNAGLSFGAVTIAGGLLGTLLGGRLKGGLKTAAAGLFTSIPLGLAALNSSALQTALLFFFLAQAAIFLHAAPLESAMVSFLPNGRRSLGFAANIVVVHIFGDAFSPLVVGFASAYWGLKSALAGSMIGLLAAGFFCAYASRLDRPSPGALHA